MRFLKNLTIKNNTKRVFSDFNDALTKYIMIKPNVSMSEIIQDVSFLQTIPIRGLTAGVETDSSIFHEILTALPEEQKNDNFVILFLLICSIVFYELRYDNTIGSDEDKKHVMITLESLLNKERSKYP